MAIPAVILSQVLIALKWSDAKWGTLVSILIIALALFARADHGLTVSVRHEAEDLLSRTFHSEDRVTEEMLQTLPPVVAKWLRATQVVGKPRMSSVYLKQAGRLRLKENARWMRVEAAQLVGTHHPEFIWYARVHLLPFVWFRGRDIFRDGRGNMLIRLLSIIPIADARSKEVDEASLVRFLGEMVWYPTAALESYVTWEQIDSSSARATIAHGGKQVSGVFTFNERGEVVTFRAHRYFARGGEFSLENWVVSMGQYVEIQGIRLPLRAEVTWELETGIFYLVQA